MATHDEARATGSVAQQLDLYFTETIFICPHSPFLVSFSSSASFSLLFRLTAPTIELLVKF